MNDSDTTWDSLRRICIWRTYDRGGYVKEWWDYVNIFSLSCLNFGVNLDFDACAKQMMELAGLEMKRIEHCMQDGGGSIDQDTHVPNTLLEAGVESANMGGTAIDHFSMYVNQVKIHVTVSFENVLTAVCSAFAEGSEREVCTECHDLPRKESIGCVKGFQSSKQLPEGQERRPLSVYLFSFSLSVLFPFLGMTAYIYFQRSQRLLRAKVHEIVVGPCVKYLFFKLKLLFSFPLNVPLAFQRPTASVFPVQMVSLECDL